MPREKVKKMSDKCLLLKTPDSRCFFTEEKNYPLLVEFGRTFNAEISVVKTKTQVQVLELPDLAKMICNQKPVECPPYDILETKLPSTKELDTNRQEKIKKTREITNFIRAELLGGKIVSSPELEQKYPETKKGSISNYITRTKRELQAQGHHIVKVKPGCYRIAPELKPDF